MRKIFLSLLSCGVVALLASSCVEDKGNYDYVAADALFPIEITDHEGGITIMALDPLHVPMEVTGNENGTYKYVWQYVVAGGSDLKTLSESTVSPDLDLAVCPLAVGAYDIYFEVRDEALGVFRRAAKFTLRVESSYIPGWYVLNENNGNSNIDYVADGTLQTVINEEEEEEEIGVPPGTVYDNILMDDIPGLPRFFNHLGFYSTDLPELNSNNEPTGKYIIYTYSLYGNPSSSTWIGRQGAFMAVTDQTMATYNAADMTPIKTTPEEFFYDSRDIPDMSTIRNFQAYAMDYKAARPVGGSTGNYSLYLTTGDGQLHIATLAMTQSVYGRFLSAKVGVPDPVTKVPADYDIGPMVGMLGSDHGMNGSMLVYDNIRGAFMYSSMLYAQSFLLWPDQVNFTVAGDPWLNPNVTPDAAAAPINDMNYDLVWLANRNAGYFFSALLKSKTSDEYRLFVSPPGVGKPNTTAAGATHMFKGDMATGYDSYSALMPLVRNVWPFERTATVVPGSKLIDPAIVNRFMVIGSQNVFFALGNKVYWYNPAIDLAGAAREPELFAIPANETIENVIVISGHPTEGGNQHHAMVLSNDDSGNWHLRAYPVSDTAQTRALTVEEFSDPEYGPSMEATGVGRGKSMAYRGGKYVVYYN